jgi:hypothetical protein
MANSRKKLSDILSNGSGDNFRNNWNATAAADDFGPLPPGEYTVRILSGELFTSKRNSTPGYKLTCEVTEGDYEGRRVWLDFWLTPAALPMTKRDLAKIGVERPEQLEQPLPPGILLSVKVALRRDDDGNETNKVTRFECVGVEPGDAFEPKDGEGDGGRVFDPADLDGKPKDSGPPTSGDLLPTPANNSGPYGGDRR